jgi:hypothetical protein
LETEQASERVDELEQSFDADVNELKDKIEVSISELKNELDADYDNVTASITQLDVKSED